MSWKDKLRTIKPIAYQPKLKYVELLEAWFRAEVRGLPAE